MRAARLSTVITSGVPFLLGSFGDLRPHRLNFFRTQVMRHVLVNRSADQLGDRRASSLVERLQHPPVRGLDVDVDSAFDGRHGARYTPLSPATQVSRPDWHSM